MSQMEWIRELVRAEQQIEDAGVIDSSPDLDPDVALQNETFEFMQDLKAHFIESASAFNKLRGLTVGGVKIYGISNTAADFMLFRNGFKLLFTVRHAGLIAVKFSFQGAGMMSGTTSLNESESHEGNDDLIEARSAAFGEFVWTYRNLPVNQDYMVRYYLSRFVKESAK